MAPSDGACLRARRPRALACSLTAALSRTRTSAQFFGSGNEMTAPGCAPAGA